MYLLTYDYQQANDNLSGPGWHWTEKRIICDSPEELQGHLDGLYSTIGERRHAWEHKDPKWRDKTFIAPFRRIKLHTLSEADLTPFLTGAQAAHDESMAEAEISRLAKRAEWEQKERADLARLQAKYPEVA